MIAAIKQPHPATPSQIGNQQLRALEKLAEIFKETSTVGGEILAPPRVQKIKRVEQQTTKPTALPRVPVQHTIYHKQPKVPVQTIAIARIPRLPPLPKNFHKKLTTTTPNSTYVTANHLTTVHDINTL